MGKTVVEIPAVNVTITEKELNSFLKERVLNRIWEGDTSPVIEQQIDKVLVAALKGMTKDEAVMKTVTKEVADCVMEQMIDNIYDHNLLDKECKSIIREAKVRLGLIKPKKK